MLYQTIPQTREGALLAVVIAAIQRATPWLRVDGIFAPEHHQIVVGFDTLASWHTYRQIVGAATPESGVTG